MSAWATPRLGSLLLSQAILATTALVAAGARAQTPITVTGPTEPGSVLLNHPIVVDTAHLKSGDKDVTLFGVKGAEGDAVQGDAVRGLQAFITANGDRVTCHPHSAGGDVCVLPTGLDVGATALANGAAQTIADSSADYKQQETAAQAAHLGMWAALPSLPVELQHPVVQTTAEIVGDGHVFLLSGIVGFNAQFYTMQLQSYIVAHGDRLTCQAQAGGGAVCVLPNGTDIARVALQNGLARVSADATATYRADQAKAVASKNGFWFDTPQAVLAALPPPAVVQPCCSVDPNDTLDGLSYQDGVPEALVDGEPAFFFYAGLLGFGFFDVHHHWHPAPEAIRAQLERFHPQGSGLRAAGPGEAPVQATAFRAPGDYGSGNFHAPYLPGAVPFRPPVLPGSNLGIAANGLASGAIRPLGAGQGIGPIGTGQGIGPIGTGQGIGPIGPRLAVGPGFVNRSFERVGHPIYVPLVQPRVGIRPEIGVRPIAPIGIAPHGFLGRR